MSWPFLVNSSCTTIPDLAVFNHRLRDLNSETAPSLPEDIRGRRRERLRRELEEHQGNHQKLKEKEAMMGIEMPVWVLNQIEAEERHIAEIAGELKGLD